MGSLIDIRRRIKSTKNTAQITQAMKMISASRLRRASEKAVAARPYAERLFGVHRSVLGRMTELDGPFYTAGEGKTLLVVLSGDKGLCGPFNANITKYVERKFKSEGRDDFAVLPIGSKSVQFYTKDPVQMIKGFSAVFRDVNLALAEEIGEILIRRFKTEDFGRVVLIFNAFKNVMIQEVTEWQLLPLEKETSDAIDSGAEHLAEPGLPQILDELSPRVVVTRIYQALMESCASEHAARMTAMDSATRNAKEMIEKLTLEMNKARQAAITSELIEVVSGAAAL